MQKLAKILALVGVVLVLLVLTAGIAYRLGENRTEERILHGNTTADAGQSTAPPESYNRAIADMRNQLNRLTNDYESACYNYQTLYDAYDALYAKAGASSGQQKVVRPDSARGNEVSCYR